MSQKGFAPILLLFGIIIITAIVAGAYYFGKTQSPKSQPQIAATPTPSAKVDETVYTEASRSANWKTYINKKLGFSFMYPPQMYIYATEYNSTNSGEVTVMSIPREQVAELKNKNDYQQLHDLGYYSVSVYISENAKVGQQGLPLTLENLVSGIDGTPIYLPDLQGRKNVRYESRFGWDNSKDEYGKDVMLYILDGTTLYRIEGITHNLQKAPDSLIKQIETTFKFTN